MALLLAISVMIPAGLVALTASPATAAVTAVSVTPSSYVAGAAVNYDIAFTTTAGLTAGCRIIVDFGAGTTFTTPIAVTVTGTGVVLDTPAIVGEEVTLIVLAGTVPASANTVSFTGYKITNPTYPAGLKTLTVATNLDAVGSVTYTIAAGALGSIAMGVEPPATGIIAGQVITPAVTAIANDLYGNPKDGVDIVANKVLGTGTLSGDVDKLTTGGGIATFDDLRIDTEGLKNLYFSSGSYGDNSINFTIDPAVSINSPTFSWPAYAKTGGTVPVAFTVNSTTTSPGDLRGQICPAGSASWVAALPDVNNVSLSTGANPFSYDVTMTGVGTGTYDIRAGIRQPTGSGTWVYSTPQLSAVVVDNTIPSVNLINPDGGNYVPYNSPYLVSWNVTDAIPTPSSITVTALVSLDGGLTYPYPAFGPISGLSKSGSYPWAPWATVPGGDQPRARMKLTVTDLAGNSASDNSTADFYILSTPPQIIFSIPGASTTWPAGFSQDITFTTISALSLNVDYRLQIDRCGVISDITPGWLTNRPPGLTTYTWTVPPDYRGPAQIIATVRDKCGITGGALTLPFTISDVQAPRVTVTSPTTGDNVYNGVPTNICWTASDNVTRTCGTSLDLTYKWYLSTNGGTDWGPELGSWAWGQSPTTPICNPPWLPWTPSVTEAKTNCKIMVTATDQATPTPNMGVGYSSTFAIKMQPTQVPTVTVTNPNSGSVQAGTSLNITWTASDPSSDTLNFALEYSTSGSFPGTPIVALNNRELDTNHQYSGTFCWAVPQGITGPVYIRVTATNAFGPGYDQSDDAVMVTAADTSGGLSTYLIPLDTGWNLISLQTIPTCSSIESVLADVLPNVVSVWYIMPESSGCVGYNCWKSYSPGGAAVSSLHTIEDGKAYWVKVSSPCMLSYQGRKSVSGRPTQKYNVYTDWNMVGYKSTITGIGHTAEDYFTVSHEPVMWRWDASIQDFVLVSNTTPLIPGDGYWVNFTADGIINGFLD